MKIERFQLTTERYSNSHVSVKTTINGVTAQRFYSPLMSNNEAEALFLSWVNKNNN